MKHNVQQIRIGKHDFGIIGLTHAIESVASEHRSATDEVIAEALVETLSTDNYISQNVREQFKQAFLREYKKHFNLPVSEEADDELVATVVGPGCPRCENLEMEVMMALSELDLPARVDHVRDVKQIAEMGIMGTPALLINKKVKCVGSVPSKNQIMEWLKAYKENRQ